MESKICENAELFKMLSNPIRLCILINLTLNGKKNVTELMNCSQVGQSSVSQQLTKLKLAKIISSTKSGNEVYYELSSKKVESIIKEIIRMEE